MAYRKDSLWKTVDWWTIALYVVLIVCGWFSVCGASYDYGDPDFLNFTTRAGKQYFLLRYTLTDLIPHQRIKTKDIFKTKVHPNVGQPTFKDALLFYS